MQLHDGRNAVFRHDKELVASKRFGRMNQRQESLLCLGQSLEPKLLKFGPGGAQMASRRSICGCMTASSATTIW